MNPFKFAYQRIFKGVADRDLWSLDVYLAKIISTSIRQMLKQKHLGVPGVLFQELSINLNPTSEEEELLQRTWRIILVKMAEGFETYVETLTECDDLSEEEHIVRIEKFDLSMALFWKYLSCLWL